MTSASNRRVLVVDIGGTSIKLHLTDHLGFGELPSSSDLTPDEMVGRVKQATAGVVYDVVSIGYPGVVRGNAIRVEPRNLGRGWVGYDFEAAFGKPVRILNDAAMQAIGSYAGKTMLFLGLGTGLGAALIVHGMLQPLELAHLPYDSGSTYESCLGKRGVDRLGETEWRKKLFEIVPRLRAAFQVDYVVLGGGHAHLLDELPPDTRRGDNELAFQGGVRLWDPESPVRLG